MWGNSSFFPRLEVAHLWAAVAMNTLSASHSCAYDVIVIFFGPTGIFAHCFRYISHLLQMIKLTNLAKFKWKSTCFFLSEILTRIGWQKSCQHRDSIPGPFDTSPLDFVAASPMFFCHNSYWRVALSNISRYIICARFNLKISRRRSRCQSRKRKLADKNVKSN